MKKNLTPVTITDKNGRATTVYRKADTVQSKTASIPPVSINDMHEKYSKVMESTRSWREARSLEKERLESGREEKEEIISRLIKFCGISYLEKADDLKSRRDTHYLESLRSMENLVTRQPKDQAFIVRISTLHKNLTGTTFRDWTQLADRHYSALLNNPISDDKTPQNSTAILSACLRFNAARKHETGETPTVQQERNYLLLNLAALNSRLEGTKIREGGGWGYTTCLNNEELIEFALNCTDSERLMRVCMTIKGTDITRFREAVAVADGETTSTLANGAL